VSDDVAGTFSSLGHNLVGSTNGSTGFGALGDLLNTDPQLAPLADNGGPTMTHALLLSSPVIDAGDNTGAPATDQRGLPRIVGNGMDIGALESEHLPYALAALTLSAGTLFPSFDSETTNYSALVGISITNITVTPTSQDPNATIGVGTNGGPYTIVASGIASDPLPLQSGTNLIEVQVTAWDNVTVRTYTVAVTRDVETPAAPVFTSCSVPAAGQIWLHGTGSAGMTYTLQSSTNLVDWVYHTNIVASPSGWIEWQGGADPNAPACFYRLCWP